MEFGNWLFEGKGTLLLFAFFAMAGVFCLFISGYFLYVFTNLK